jgi:hypothetical protein
VVISLEKALNKEQVQSQHLVTKNESLIKELEELKAQNMQLTFLNQKLMQDPQFVPATNRTAAAAAVAPTQAAVTSTNSPRKGLLLPEAEVKKVIDSVQDLLQQNDIFQQQFDAVQKVMRKFFKYQIEEDEMKDEVLKVRCCRCCCRCWVYHTDCGCLS